jgi:hypothetical protein
VINSGARPGSGGAFEEAFPEALGPLRGILNADSAEGERQTSPSLQLLVQNFGVADGEQALRPFTGADRVELICNRVLEEEVITAWALGPHDKASVFFNFHAALGVLADLSKASNPVELLALRGKLLGGSVTPPASDVATIDEVREVVRQQGQVLQASVTPLRIHQALIRGCW